MKKKKWHRHVILLWKPSFWSHPRDFQDQNSPCRQMCQTCSNTRLSPDPVNPGCRYTPSNSDSRTSLVDPSARLVQVNPGSRLALVEQMNRLDHPWTMAAGLLTVLTCKTSQKLWPGWLVKNSPCWSQFVKNEDFFKITDTTKMQQDLKRW